MDAPARRALDILSLMVLEDGHRWGETAAGFQRENAAAILDPGAPLQHWIELPRGARKTTDIAAVVLAALREQAPPMARAYVGAADEDQARELVDAARGLVERTPELAGEFRVTDLVITSARTGASVTALPADVSAMGKRAWLIVLDEVCNWPDVRKHRRFWGVLTSGNRKIADCRTVVISNSGDPQHWSWKRREVARVSRHWRFCTVPGPLPWLTADDLEVLRENAETASEFDRLHMNVWAAAEDRLASREDLAACTVLPGPLPPRGGVRYVITADLGAVNDRTIVAVMHADDGPAGRKVVLDRIQRWQGTRDEPVPLGEVRDSVRSLSAEYSGAGVVMDPWQGKLLAQELRDAGVVVSEFAFTTTSVGHLALSLHSAIRQHRLDLPEDEDLADELASVRLRKNTAGVYRLDHDASGHDDQAVTLALGCHHLLDAAPEPQFLMHADSLPQAGECNQFGAEVLQARGNWAQRVDPGDPWAAADREDDNITRRICRPA